MGELRGEESNRIAVELRDGSRLVGTTSLTELAFVTTDGRPTKVELSKAMGISVGDDREIATISLHGGVIRGVIETEKLDLTGVFGKVSVPFDEVQRLQNVNLKLGLIAHYPLDDDFRDHSGLGNHEQERGGVSFDAGRIRKAARFDGSDDYLEIEPKSDVSKIDDFSVVAWVYVDSWKLAHPGSGLDRQYIFDGHSKDSKSPYEGRPGFNLILDGRVGAEFVSNGVKADVNHSMETRDAVPLSGRWRLVAFVRQNRVEHNYVDGKVAGSTVFYSSGDWRKPLNMKHTWFVGTFAGNNPTYSVPAGFRYGRRGLIDDLRIYDRALNDEEMRALFRVGKDGNRHGAQPSLGLPALYKPGRAAAD